MKESLDGQLIKLSDLDIRYDFKRCELFCVYCLSGEPVENDLPKPAIDCVARAIPRRLYHACEIRPPRVGSEKPSLLKVAIWKSEVAGHQVNHFTLNRLATE